MLNKISAFWRARELTAPGETVICALSGGADSVALTFALTLLAKKLDIQVSAAHFNHHLRGGESDRDERFVRDFCARFDIPLFVGSARVLPGKKGLEAAAREARYAFLDTLPGIVATAHTANDNAETVLLHLLRGTGLKGLGAIAPKSEKRIRPMLTVTRDEVLAFLEEYSLPHVEDSSNISDDFLRNRLRHQVMPLLTRENPRLAENLSATALALREDEAALSSLTSTGSTLEVPALRAMPAALRRRTLARFLEEQGVPEPERAHIALAERLVFSRCPSARAMFPGGVVLARQYAVLAPCRELSPQEPVPLPCPGTVTLPALGLLVTCRPAEACFNAPDAFTVLPRGEMVLRSRASGDRFRLPGGSKPLKKLFIDRKIPAGLRPAIPVIGDEQGVLGVYGLGASLDAAGPGVEIRFTRINPSDPL